MDATAKNLNDERATVACVNGRLVGSEDFELNLFHPLVVVVGVVVV